VTDERPAGAAVNAAAAAAQDVVPEYASRFERREEYGPLEELAGRVQRAAVEACAETLRRRSEAEA
jgi:hypothetical protein